jgi:P27 family predicted phage terminase small subunit
MCRHLGELGRLKGGDLCALARYCNKMSDWEALRKAVTTPAGNTRLTYEHTTTAGDLILKPRPEFAMMKDVEVEMLKIEREFGLTPSARAAVTQKLIDAAATQKPPPAARAVPNGQPEPDAGNPPAASVPPAPATPIGILAPRGTKH